MKTKIWTVEEVTYLRDNYSKFGIDYCANFLGRTNDSIRLKAQREKLIAPPRPSRTHEEYENILFEMESPAFPIERYVTNKTYIKHECVNGHIWDARPDCIMRGYGCPECAVTGFSPDSPAIFYYIKITHDNLTYYKVGVTNKSVSDRFYKDRDKTIKILMERHFDIGAEAKALETTILKKFSEDRQNISGWLKSKGNTELFEYDILNLDLDLQAK